MTRQASGDHKLQARIRALTQARRIIVFVVGGITHSEIRVAHQLGKKLKRDVILGSTSVDNPATFLEHMHQLSILGAIVKERK